MRNKKAMFLLLVVLLPLVSITPIQGINTSTGRIEHQVGDLVFEAEYNISTNFQEWKITDNKAVDIAVYLTNATGIPSIDVYDVFIEHMHVDCYIESTIYYFDGILQDTMDDKIHGGTQIGFLVTPEYPYYETFGIEGTSPTFVDSLYTAYGFYNYAIAVGEQDTFKYSEDQLRDTYGVYGNTLYFVFDVCVKLGNEDDYHKYVFSDNIFVDLNGTITENNDNQYDMPATQPFPNIGCIAAAFSILGIAVIGSIINKRRNK